MKLIVGLGNPGKEYSNTLHNVGFLTVDFLADKLNISSFEQKFHSLIAKSNIEGNRFILLKPQTYMNLSGKAVLSCVQYFKISVEDIIVIFDDVDLVPGKVRFRRSGSAGGHKGVHSIIEHLKTAEFNRVRIGIGRPNGNISVANYVLRPCSQIQYENFLQVRDPVTDRLLEFIQNGNFDNTSFSCS